MQRHGAKTVFFGRFIAILRFTAAWVAGLGRMPWWRFLFWNAAGGIVWATAVGLVAYYGGQAAAGCDPALRPLRGRRGRGARRRRRGRDPLRPAPARETALANTENPPGRNPQRTPPLEKRAASPRLAESPPACGTHFGHVGGHLPRARGARPDTGSRERGSRPSPSRSRDRLGWEEARIALLRFGALHHDIGKVAVRRDLLRKSGPLSLDELAEIRTHPSKGAELVRPLRAARQALPYVLFHHERWDGDGYPSRIRGRGDPARGPPARRRRRVRRDDLAAAVPPGAHARTRAARAVLVRRHAVRPRAHGALRRPVERAGRRRRVLNTRPDLELRLRPRDHLVDELARPEVAAEVGRAEACSDRFEARLRGSRGLRAARRRRRARAARRRRGSSPSGWRRSCPAATARCRARPRP